MYIVPSLLIRARAVNSFPGIKFLSRCIPPPLYTPVRAMAHFASAFWNNTEISQRQTVGYRVRKRRVQR